MITVNAGFGGAGLRAGYAAIPGGIGNAMSRSHTLIVPLILLAIASAHAQNPPASLPSQRNIDFARDIRPLLAERCFSCHGPGEQMAGLRLDQKESALSLAVVPGNSRASKLIMRVTSEAEGFRMPLRGIPLGDDQIRLLKNWIDAGAPWPQELANPPLVPQQADPNATALFSAIKKGDSQKISLLLRDRKLANAKDRSGTTPLMYASLHSDPEVVKLLLRQGANPNAQNDAGATALMWAVDDLETVRLLLAAGADVNARAKSGNTALIIAAATSNSGPVVEELLRKGAYVNARNLDGDGALVYAAALAGNATLNTLISNGAAIEPEERGAVTPLTSAAYVGNIDALKILLEKGAHIDAADCCATALMPAAAFDDKKTVSFLLARGANVNFSSGRRILGSPEVGTPLMWASYAEAQDPELVSMLLAKGADVNARTADGQTALSRARPRGNSPVVDLLLRAGASDTHPAAAAPGPARHNLSPGVKTAVERSVALLLNSSAVWYKNRACVSCHNQTLPAIAVALARERNFQVDERSAAEQSAKTAARLAETREPLLQMMTAQPGVGGGAHSAGYALLALAAEKHPADETTDAIVRFIASKQLPNGRWRPDMFRPPLEYSDFSATALCLHALQVYGAGRQQPKYRQRIEWARQWLSSAEPRFNEEQVFQLLGLTWAGVSRSELQNLAAALTSEQRKDGGWSQLRSLESDAYATGQALFALHETGLPASDARYQRGIKFLLETQDEDGSWWVHSRSFPIQPYFDAGFPHGKDQFISAAGTSWAAMALAVTKEPILH